MHRFWILLLAFAVLLGLLIPAAAAAAETPFADVSPEDWYACAIGDVYRRKLMIGTGDDTFSPEDTLTRAMVVTVLWRMAGEPEAPEDMSAPFTDVPDGAWFYDAVKWAAAEEVTYGYGDGSFGAMDQVTREELSVFFYRWADAMEADVSCDASLYPQDRETVPSDWAEDAVAWARDRGFLNWREVRLDRGGMGGSGSTGYRICPQDPATRGETAVFLSRFCRTYLDEADGERPTVLYRPIADHGDWGGYRWDFMTLELPETWQGNYFVTSAAYDSVLEAVSFTFLDRSVHEARTSQGRLFTLTLFPEGKDSSWFGNWEELGDAAPGKSGLVCTLDAGPIMGRLCLYVEYFADEDGMWAEQGMRIYDPEQPGNCLKELADVEGILHTLRFDGEVKVVETAPDYGDLME